jgi:hypothetical protein
MRDTEKKTLEFIKLGYNDVSTDFRVSLTSLRTIKKALKLVPNYNKFDGNNLSERIDEIKDCIMYLEFGREGSPVIYIHIPSWNHQVIDSKKGEQKKFSPEEISQMRSRVKLWLEAMGADEAEVDSYVDTKLRGWWD